MSSAATVMTHAFLTQPQTLVAANDVIHRIPQPMSGETRSWHRDSPDFLNDPISFIAKHPQLFSEDLQEMAAYQLKVKSDERLDWGTLPDALDQCAKGAEYLRQKSETADVIARIIVQAKREEMLTFVKDAKFVEKKAFFENLANLPADNNGMLAIHDVASGMLEAGALPLIPKFEQDLQRVTAKVDEVNTELMELDRQYTTLFLSVRKVAQLARAAADVSRGKASGVD
eukprot:CAMPEP_0119325186 /NCGR_PEP_ID=MMETSP1333-20130426/65180_1 /TAXON_ID=418940 /ORGANISM="Scyphosphaera apsteinii, Strain RCC1455" /LENGTH=228 /DNA_ID=CAMNT_0007333089 /DNA_START=61 /DNA_END=747 /DNA_ORIENTATION=+